MDTEVAKVRELLAEELWPAVLKAQGDDFEPLYRVLMHFGTTFRKGSTHRQAVIELLKTFTSHEDVEIRATLRGALTILTGIEKR